MDRFAPALVLLLAAVACSKEPLPSAAAAEAGAGSATAKGLAGDFSAPVATFCGSLCAKDPVHERMVETILTRLKAAGIPAVIAESAGATLSVDGSRAEEARGILKDLRDREHFPIEVWRGPNDGGALERVE